MDNYSVLLVDDDPKLLDLLVNYFTKEQFTVLAARDGEEALRIFRKEQPQLLVLDLMLPKSTAGTCAGPSGRTVPSPLSCSPPGMRNSTGSWDWNWGRMIM